MSVQFYDYSPRSADFKHDVIAGLARRPRAIPPKYFYDQTGSELFDRICEQPEYYPAQTEIGIYRRHAADIAECIGRGCVLVELGSGASEKIRPLLESLRPRQYLGVDISKAFLLEATNHLAEDYPWLEVRAVCADFTERLALPPQCADGPVAAFYPGSSIGNFEPRQAEELIRRVRRLVGKGGKFLIGVDLEKDRDILHRAYNDEAGVTAAFNLNLLNRMNAELGANINVDQFEHEAFYNEAAGRVEMHLVSTARQRFQIDGRQFSLSPGERIHTENSHKYSLPRFADLARGADFAVDKVWTDDKKFFSAQLLTAV